MLILGDIHNKVELADSILRTKPGKHIILGDIMDSFDDTPKNAVKNAAFFKKWLDFGHIILMGNHDLPYFYPGYRCPGWTKEKHAAFISNIDIVHYRQKIKFCHFDRNILFSHAGFTSWMYRSILNKDVSFVELANREIHAAAEKMTHHPAIWCGSSRGGKDNYSGILWADWSEVTRYSDQNMPRQVFGHTPDFMYKQNLKRRLYCIDCQLKYYAEVDNQDGLVFHKV